MESVLVTGVSTGIGWGITKVLIAHGYRVFGSVRREEDANRLVAEFGAAFVPVLFDVTDEEKVHAAAKQVQEHLNGGTLLGLVNNAGIAVPGPLMHLPIQDFRKQIEVNLIGQLIVTQAFLPLLGAELAPKGKPGRIINIGSSSGKAGSPFLGAYSASKHALEGFSESLRRELMLYGIDVILVGPGPVVTPIWDKAEQMDLSLYKDTDFMQPALKFQKYALENGRNGYPPEKVGEVVLHALTANKPRVRYAVVRGNPIMHFFEDILPRRFIDGIVAKNLGLKPRSQAAGAVKTSD